MPKLTDSRSIELKCTLCPKSPTFSDVSHLLTHISSKSHLAHRFKLQIRAGGELEAKSQLDEFDYWYHANDLGTLLSKRMAAKEEKKNGKEKKSRKVSASIKDEKKRTKEPTLTDTPIYRAPVPQMHLWPTQTHLEEFSMTEWERSAYETPTARRQIPGFSRHDTPSDEPLDPKLTTPWKFEGEEYDDKAAEPKLTDSAKLKGVLWPGMHLFDSATPEMKRMRNQRKDTNIIEQMQATSALVEPAEISYHANGDFRGSRDIFGSLSPIGSPVVEEAPSPKKRKPRKATFADKSVNTRRAPAARGRSVRRTKGTASRSIERSTAALQDPPTTSGLFQKPIPTLNPLAISGFGNRFFAHDDEDDEFRIPIVDTGSKKRSFSIFQDASENSPAKTESPLEERRFDLPSHSLPQFNMNGNIPSTIPPSPTPIPRLNTFRAFGKENGQPEGYNRRSHSNPTNFSRSFPSQSPYDNSFNPLFDHHYAARSHSFRELSSSFRAAGEPTPYSSFSGDFRLAGTSAHPQESQRRLSSTNTNVVTGSTDGYGV